MRKKRKKGFLLVTDNVSPPSLYSQVLSTHISSTEVSSSKKILIQTHDHLPRSDHSFSFFSKTKPSKKSKIHSLSALYYLSLFGDMVPTPTTPQTQLSSQSAPQSHWHWWSYLSESGLPWFSFLPLFFILTQARAYWF